MNMRFVGLVSWSAFATCSLLSVASLADPPATANAVQVGLGFRYGHELEEGDFNPWGTGLGLSGGYTLTNGVYAGGNFDYFFGETIEAPDGELSGNIWQLAAEGGYDIGLGDSFVIRPKAGLGIASLNSEFCLDGYGCSDDSETDFLFAPGTTFLLFTSSVSLSLDLRYDIIFSDPEALNALLFSFGIGF